MRVGGGQWTTSLVEKACYLRAPGTNRKEKLTESIRIEVRGLTIKRGDQRRPGAHVTGDISGLRIKKVEERLSREQ